MKVQDLIIQDLAIQDLTFKIFLPNIEDLRFGYYRFALLNIENSILEKLFKTQPNIENSWFWNLLFGLSNFWKVRNKQFKILKIQAVTGLLSIKNVMLSNEALITGSFLAYLVNWWFPKIKD